MAPTPTRPTIQSIAPVESGCGLHAAMAAPVLINARSVAMKIHVGRAELESDEFMGTSTPPQLALANLA